MTFYRGEHALLIRAAEITTAFRSSHPALGRAALLTHRDPRAVPQVYIGAATPPEDVALVHFNPDAKGLLTPPLPLPGLYRKVGLVPITSEGVEALREQADHDRMRVATLWKLASGLMAGPLTQEAAEQLLGPEGRQLAMLVGSQDEGLDTGVGLFDMETGEVTNEIGWMGGGTALPLRQFREERPIY